MDLPRMAAFNKYWKIVPPLSESAAAIAQRLGVERQQPAAPESQAIDEKAPAGEMSDEQFSELVSVFGMPKAVKDGGN